MPQKGAEKLSDDEAVKQVMSASYFAKETSSVASDPLELSLGDDVVAETAE